jgi:hypothetical protein
MDATPDQIAQLWLRFDNQLSTWKPEDHIHDIRNNNIKENIRLTLYKLDSAKLKHGKWSGNSIIDFFIWKLLDMMVKLGIKDVYKWFNIMDSGSMYYMYT